MDFREYLKQGEIVPEVEEPETEEQPEPETEED